SIQTSQSDCHVPTGNSFSRNANPCGASAYTCNFADPPIPNNALCSRYAFSTGTTASFAAYTMNVGGGETSRCSSGCMASYSACFSGGGSGGLLAMIVRPVAFVEMGA